MACRVVDQEDVIPKYLNGQLDPAAEDDFGMHLLECSECQDAVELLQAVRTDLLAREHQIRSYSGADTRVLWSRFALAAMVLVVCGIGFRELRHKPSVPPKAGISPDQRSVVTATSKSPSDIHFSDAPISEVSHSAPTPGDGPSQQTDNARPANTRATSKIQPYTPRDDHGVSVEDQGGGQPAPSSSGHLPEQAPGQRTEVAAQVPSQPNPTESASKNPTIPTSPTPASEEIAKLANIRPLPYSFAGVAASQPTAGGSTRGSGVPVAGVSGSSSNSKQGTSGFHTAQDYFTGGMSAYVDRNYGTAADLLGEAVRLDPDSSEANLYFGISKLLLDKPDDAVLALQAASKEKKKPAISQAGHFYLAKAYLKLGKRSEAETELRSSAAISGRLTAESNALLQRLQSIPAAIPNSN